MAEYIQMMNMNCHNICAYRLRQNIMRMKKMLQYLCV